MNELEGVPLAAESSNEASDLSGLPWPKTWRGAYFVVLATFACYIALLIALTELGK